MGNAFARTLPIAILTVLLPSLSPAATTLRFAPVVVDSEMAGDVKAVCDIDGDGYQDLVIAGAISEGLNWYHNPTWQRVTIVRPRVEFTTDGACEDVDGDGDPDFVVPDGNGADNLLWFENPRPSANPFEGSRWRRRVVGSIGGWGKDVELADFDSNGLTDIITRSTNQIRAFFQISPGQWRAVSVAAQSLGKEGLASGDIDADGDMDLVVRGAWLTNPGFERARLSANWVEHSIGPAPAEFKAVVADIDQDGKADVLFSSSEGIADVTWWTPADGGPEGKWEGHQIVRSLERAHTLQVGDMDGDGDEDVVVAQMHTAKSPRVFVRLNEDGRGRRWRTALISRTGLHNGAVADIDGDGNPDVFGANWTGHPPLRLWLNHTRPSRVPTSLSDWTPLLLSRRHHHTFGIGFGDIDGDVDNVIVSGGFANFNIGPNACSDLVRPVARFCTNPLDAVGLVGVQRRGV